jgi:dephospho-CoA kinase
MDMIGEKKVYSLAFCGKMGSGKTSASLIALGLMTELFGQDNSIGYIIKFAQPLYQSMLAFHRNKGGNAERNFLQRLGDLARREFGDDIFVNIFEENVAGLITNRLPQLTQEHVLVMTDDLRFLSEYKLLKKLGFTIVGVEAPEDLRQRRLGDAFANIRHRSETELSLFSPDYVIYNDVEEPQLTTLEKNLRTLLEEIKFFESK